MLLYNKEIKNKGEIKIMFRAIMLVLLLTFGDNWGAKVSAESVKNEEKNNEGFCPKEKVREIYADLLNELTFDTEVGELCERKKHNTVGEAFQNDVEVTKTLKKGVCRQISHRLIYDLSKICSRAYALVLGKPGNSHVAVMYEGEDGQYVADLSREIQYCENFPNMFKRNKPMLFKLPLDDYIEMNKNVCNIAYANESLANNKKAWYELNFVPLHINQMCQQND